MLSRAEKLHLKRLICDTVVLVCKNGLVPKLQREFVIDGLIGISLEQDDLMLVSINERVGHTESEVDSVGSGDEARCAADRKRRHLMDCDESSASKIPHDAKSHILSRQLSPRETFVHHQGISHLSGRLQEPSANILSSHLHSPSANILHRHRANHIMDHSLQPELIEPVIVTPHTPEFESPLAVNMCPPISYTELTFFYSRRGNRKVALRGFSYNMERKGKFGDVYMRCDMRQLQCRGKLKIDAHDKVTITSEHNHPPDISRTQDKVTRSKNTMDPSERFQYTPPVKLEPPGPETPPFPPGQKPPDPAVPRRKKLHYLDDIDESHMDDEVRGHLSNIQGHLKDELKQHVGGGYSVFPSLTDDLGDNGRTYNSLGDNTISYNSLGDNTISYNSLGDNTINYNSLGDNMISHNSLGDNTINYNSVGDNTSKSHDTQKEEVINVGSPDPYEILNYLNNADYDLHEGKTNNTGTAIDYATTTQKSSARRKRPPVRPRTEEEYHIEIQSDEESEHNYELVFTKSSCQRRSSSVDGEMTGLCSDINDSDIMSQAYDKVDIISDNPSNHVQNNDELRSENMADNGPLSRNMADNGPLSRNMADNGPLSRNMADNGPLSRNMADNGPLSRNMADNGPLSRNMADNDPLSRNMADNGPLSRNMSSHVTNHLELTDDWDDSVGGSKPVTQSPDPVTALPDPYQILNYLNNAEYKEERGGERGVDEGGVVGRGVGEGGVRERGLGRGTGEKGEEDESQSDTEVT